MKYFKSVVVLYTILLCFAFSSIGNAQLQKSIINIPEFTFTEMSPLSIDKIDSVDLEYNNIKNIRFFVLDPYTLTVTPSPTRVPRKATGSEKVGYYKSSFDIVKVDNTTLDLSTWGKGSVWVNGHRLDDFSNNRKSVICPAEYLNKKNNEIIILDLLGPEEAKVTGLKVINNKTINIKDIDNNKSLLLHYNKPADYFEETLVIGNGNLGASIYGGVKENRISLNDITLWTGEPEGEPYSPDAYKNIKSIREALFNEEYDMANKLNMQVQGHFSENYQPLGTLTITDLNFDNNVSNYYRSLNISNAIASDSFINNGVTYSREYFASAPDSVIVIKLKTDGGKMNYRLSFHSLLPHKCIAYKTDDKKSKDRYRTLDFVPTKSSNGTAEMQIDGYAAYNSLPGYYDGEEEKFRYDEKRGIHFRSIIKVITSDGSVKSPYTDIIDIEDCSEAIVIFSNVTSFNGPYKDPVKEGRKYRKDVAERISNASTLSYDDLLKRHVNDYQSLFSRLDIDLGKTDESLLAYSTDEQLKRNVDESTFNPDLEELYFQFGRYLLISSSRTDGVPANLQGLWNEYLTPPWSSNYTTNINVEENYWPAEIANLGELQLSSMIGWIKNLPKSGEISAKNYYGVQNGWNLGQNSDIWCMTNPVGMRSGDPCWACWTMGGAWLSTHLWEHYAFTMDKEYLSSVFDVMKGAADFCMNWLIEKDGYLLTAPGTSPEAKYITPDGVHAATLYGGTADLAMIRECLIDTRDAAKVLGYDKMYIESIDNTLKRLLPYKIGSRGNLQEWFFDWEDDDWQHRHQSHLFGLFPGHHITLKNNPELANACAKSLEIKGDKTTGWSTGWRVNLFARLHDAPNAYHIYRKLLSYVSPDEYHGADKVWGGGTYPNLLDAHNPFQIDGNFGGTAGVIEMLVQSSLEDGVVLLPALPDNWKKEGHLNGVRVRGGFELSFAWRNGKITSLSVKNVSGLKRSLKISSGKNIWNVSLGPGKSKIILK